MSLLHPSDPAWPKLASDEIALLVDATPGLMTVHHIGSTSVTGLPAKPIIDLLPVFENSNAQMNAQSAFEALGYEWLGEHGLPGRSYARKSDPETGAKLFHAHGYTQIHHDIARHLAFRDALRGNASLRAAYTSVKASCAARHPEGGAAYGECKSNWINKAETRALARIDKIVQ